MAKYISDQDTKKIKVNKNGQPKKKSRCLKCCLSTLIIVVVLLGAGIGVGCYFGNKILRENFDVSLGECFGVIFNLKNYKKVEKNQLNNAYGVNDADEFITSLADAVFLKDDIDVSEVKSFVIDLAEELYTKKQASDELVDRALKFYNFDNFNSQKAADYTEDNIRDYFLTVTDKNTAGFLNDVILQSVLKKVDLKDMLGDAFKDFDIDLSSLKPEELIKLSQLTFYKTEGEHPEARMSAIVKVELRKISDPAIKGVINGEGLLGEDSNGFFKWGINVGGSIAKGMANLFILPKVLYVTVDMSLVNAEVPDMRLNSTTKENWNTVDKISAELNSSKDGVKLSLSDMVGGYFKEDGAVGKIIKTLNGAVPLNDVIDKNDKNENTVKLDALGLVLDFAVNNKLEEGDDVKSTRLYEVFSTLFSLNSDTVIENNGKPDYETAKYILDGQGRLTYDENGLPKFTNVAPGRDPAIIKEDYDDAIVAAFKEAYGLKEGVSADALISLILGGEGDLLDLFDAEEIKRLIESDESEIKGVTITDRMMAAIVKARLTNFISGTVFDISLLKTRYVLLDVVPEEGQIDHNILEAGIDVDFKGILKGLSGSGAMTKVLTAILPDTPMLVIIRTDITLNQKEDFYLKDEVMIDKLTAEKTGRMIATINSILTAFGTDGFSFKELIDNIAGIRTQIDKMSNTLPGIRLGESRLVMPDVFEAVASILQKENNLEISSGELKEYLRDYMNPVLPDTDFTPGGIEEELYEKYAFNKDKYDISDFMDTIRSNGFAFNELLDTGKLNELKTPGNQNAVTPLRITEEMFAQILFTVAQKEESLKDYVNEDTLLELKLYSREGHDFMEVTLLVDTQELIKDKDKSGIITSIIKQITVTLIIDITTAEKLKGEARQSYSVLNCNPDKTENTKNILDKLGLMYSAREKQIISDLEIAMQNMFRDINNSGVIEIIFDGSLSDAENGGGCFNMTDLITVLTNVGLKSAKAPMKNDEIKTTLDSVLSLSQKGQKRHFCPLE